ncbi:MAG: stressosome-associated protein Prli42 [Acidimicrobiia bacterium]|nr:stressosome-associated protein Prli42 [Acidimicrobiia bacterium]
MRNQKFIRITIWVTVLAMVLTAFVTGLALFRG